MTSALSPPPLALYVHLPWCVRKCPYCDFNSHQRQGELPATEYVAALLRDLNRELPGMPERPVVSVFIGGGTPSLFPGEAIEALLCGVDSALLLAPDVEITLEANPGTVEAARFAHYRQAGVNRLSLGVQSFNDMHLARLGRIHDARQAREAFDTAREAGFDNINLDLMFGLPGQELAQAMHDLETAIALGPEHLSWYQLTLEPGTRFYRQPPELPADDRIWAMQCSGVALLEAAGYAQYEVSAYARAGRQCAHNRNYWEFGDYLGIGAGAHAKVSDPLTGRVVRQSRRRGPREYMKQAGGDGVLADEQVVAAADLPFEFMLNALRLRDGFDPALFPARTGLPLSVCSSALNEGQARGLLASGRDRIRPTEEGRRFLNDLLCLFLEGENEGAVPRSAARQPGAVTGNEAVPISCSRPVAG